jgi:outer membrane lipoprotein-sorting protein
MKTITIIMAMLISISLSAQSEVKRIENNQKAIKTVPMSDKGKIARDHRVATDSLNEDPKAKPFLDNLYKKMTSEKGLAIDFVINAENNANGKIAGKLLLLKQKYNFNFAKNSIVSDGTTLWSYSGSDNEVQISTENPRNSMNPLAFLKNYKRSFRSKFIREEDNKDGSKSTIIDMQPLSAQSFHKIRIIFNTKTLLPTNMEIHQFDGSVMTYQVKKINENPTFKDSDFSFDAKSYKDVSIIDLR